MTKSIAFNVVLLFGISLMLACIVYYVDLRIFSSEVGNISCLDALFIEAVLSIILGALALLGSGGLSRASQRAAALAAAAGAISSRETIGPSEVFRRDAWKPRGFVRLGLVLMMMGVSLLIIYFLSL
jgi:hypothetical protein